MFVNRVQNVNNNNYNPAFGSIKSLKYLDGFSWDNSDSVKFVYDAFENSRVLGKFCEKNDVNVSFVVNRLSSGYKSATLQIEKIFPIKKLNFKEKILSLFKNKDEQIIYINAFGLNNKISQNRLAEKISNIKKESDLKEFWMNPFDEYKGISKRKPKWVKEWCDN